MKKINKLIEAVLGNNLKKLKSLLAEGEGFETRAREERTPLLNAVNEWDMRQIKKAVFMTLICGILLIGCNIDDDKKHIWLYFPPPETDTFIIDNSLYVFVESDVRVSLPRNFGLKIYRYDNINWIEMEDINILPFEIILDPRNTGTDIDAREIPIPLEIEAQGKPVKVRVCVEGKWLIIGKLYTKQVTDCAETEYPPKEKLMESITWLTDYPTLHE